MPGALETAMGVAALLRDHWDPLDSDFQRFYHLDLGAACFGPDQIGVRRLHALISGLPHNSALAKAMGWSWDDEREMAATLVELAHDQATSARAMVSAISGKKWKGPPKPLRWPRPELPVATQAPPRRRQPRPPLDRESVRAMLLGR